MLLKPLADIEERDLVNLVSNGVAESRTLEYKQLLPGNSDTDKKEFLADVSAFANAAGGDLLYGITEQQGAPAEITGIAGLNADLEVQRIDSMICDGIDPRIRHSSRVIALSNGRYVLVLRVEKSWIGPHRVVFKGHDKFYSRNANRKYALDVAELRTAFTVTASVSQRLRAFRTDRLIALSNDEMPIPSPAESGGPKVVLHCLPLIAFDGTKNFDVLRFSRNPEHLPPMRSSGWNYRVNFDGVVTHTNTTYTQIFRNGVLEAVDCCLVGHEHRGKRYIPSTTLEEAVLGYLPTCFRTLQKLV